MRKKRRLSGSILHLRCQASGILTPLPRLFVSQFLEVGCRIFFARNLAVEGLIDPGINAGERLSAGRPSAGERLPAGLQRIGPQRADRLIAFARLFAAESGGFVPLPALP